MNVERQAITCGHLNQSSPPSLSLCHCLSSLCVRACFSETCARTDCPLIQPACVPAEDIHPFIVHHFVVTTPLRAHPHPTSQSRRGIVRCDQPGHTNTHVHRETGRAATQSNATTCKRRNSCGPSVAEGRWRRQAQHSSCLQRPGARRRRPASSIASVQQ